MTVAAGLYCKLLARGWDLYPAGSKSATMSRARTVVTTRTGVEVYFHWHESGVVVANVLDEDTGQDVIEIAQALLWGAVRGLSRDLRLL